MEIVQPPGASRQPWAADLPVLQCLCRAVNGPVDLPWIVGDQHQVHAGSECLGGHPADAEVEHGAHVEIIGNQHALVAPVPAQQAVDHGGRMRGGPFGVDGGQRHVAKHHRRAGVVGEVAEGLPVGSQFLGRVVEPGGEQVGVVADASQTREVLDRCPHAAFVQAADIAPGDRGDRGRVVGDCPCRKPGQPVVRVVGT